MAVTQAHTPPILMIRRRDNGRIAVIGRFVIRVGQRPKLRKPTGVINCFATGVDHPQPKWEIAAGQSQIE